VSSGSYLADAMAVMLGTGFIVLVVVWVVCIVLCGLPTYPWARPPHGTRGTRPLQLWRSRGPTVFATDCRMGSLTNPPTSRNLLAVSANFCFLYSRDVFVVWQRYLQTRSQCRVCVYTYAWLIADAVAAVMLGTGFVVLVVVWVVCIVLCGLPTYPRG